MESKSGGSGEVHAHLSSQPDKGQGMSGKYDTPADAGAGGNARDFTRRARQQAEDAYASAKERGGDLRDRVGGAAHRARARADHFMEDAEDTIEEHTGALSSARDNPLAALGIAFALGFLLAGDGDEPERHPSIAKAKNQIKGAIVGGVSAAISQQLRSFIEEQGGIGTLLATLGVPLPGNRGPQAFVPDDDYPDV